MKPFRESCNEVIRKGYKNAKGVEVPPALCEELIWFEPSLQTGYFIGHCPKIKNNPVYRKGVKP